MSRKRKPKIELPPAERWRNADEMRWAARHWSARIGVNLRTIIIRPMSKKWASISTAGRLTLDASLLDVSRDLGEFVIVHELVHLLCPKAGHGKVFQSFMTAYMPDWDRRERELQGLRPEGHSRPISARKP